ncbi:MAG: hypothetical protein U0804_10310 [Gemmataceae bacterium]
MTRTTLLQLFRLPALPPPRPRRAESVFRRRRSAASALLVGVVGVLVIHAAALVLMESAFPQLRDPEYGRRSTALRARLAENPGRPLVLVVGSSRTCMGLSPAAWEAARPGGAGDPLLFNMGLVGGGPVIELMALRRAYADGFRPDVVVLEFWPPFLREDGPFHEPDRIDHARLFPGDEPLVQSYFPKPEETEAKMRRDRFFLLYETRHRLLAQIAPRWQPWDRRLELAWGGLDGWGWLPGLDEHPPRPDERLKRLAHCEPIYRGQFTGYAVHPLADRALRESVALARAKGSKVALAYLPEATEFRGWMPAEAEQRAQTYLAKLRDELHLPLIEARGWMPDELLVDGFHLSKHGAGEFTRKFGPAAAALLAGERK